MHRLFLITICSLLMLMALVLMGACNEDSEPAGTPSPGLEEPETQATATSAEATEDAAPMRIVSLAPSNTETLFALGLADSVVGVTEYCDYPPEAHDKPKVGGFSTVDLEKLIALEPDLILAANMHIETVVPELEGRGLRVLTIAPETLEEVFESILLIGEETGRSAAAEALVDEMRQRSQAVTDRVASLTEAEKPRVLYLTWHDPIWTLGSGTITNELIEMAGGINVFAELDGHQQTDLETVIGKNPEIILASTGHGSAEDSPMQWALTEERLRSVDARREGRVYQVDADLVTRPGPRIVDGLELIAGLIHPEVFTDR